MRHTDDLSDGDRVDREIAREEAQMEANYRILPKPGQRHNASGVPVSDGALAALLADAQVGMSLNPCGTPDCENCNNHRLVWWDCCNALDKSTRITLQAWLHAEGYGLPEAPWEDVGRDGAPFPRGFVGPRA